MNRIREYRENQSQKMTQEELAEKAGISRAYLSTVETGSAAPTINVAKSIAKALGKTLDEVFPSDFEE